MSTSIHKLNYFILGILEYLNLLQLHDIQKTW